MFGLRFILFAPKTFVNGIGWPSDPLSGSLLASYRASSCGTTIWWAWLMPYVNSPTRFERNVRISGATVFGRGNRFIIANPARLIRSGGIMLPGNCLPVDGSMIGISTPVVVVVCEKSPLRSRAVGIVYWFGAVNPLLRRVSREKKKKSLLRLLLKLVPGMINGPPMLPPGFS